MKTIEITKAADEKNFEAYVMQFARDQDVEVRIDPALTFEWKDHAYLTKTRHKIELRTLSDNLFERPTFINKDGRGNLFVFQRANKSDPFPSDIKLTGLRTIGGARAAIFEDRAYLPWSEMTQVSVTHCVGSEHHVDRSDDGGFYCDGVLPVFEENMIAHTGRRPEDGGRDHPFYIRAKCPIAGVRKNFMIDVNDGGSVRSPKAFYEGNVVIDAYIGVDFHGGTGLQPVRDAGGQLIVCKDNFFGRIERAAIRVGWLRDADIQDIRATQQNGEGGEDGNLGTVIWDESPRMRKNTSEAKAFSENVAVIVNKLNSVETSGFKTMIRHNEANRVNWGDPVSGISKVPNILDPFRGNNIDLWLKNWGRPGFTAAELHKRVDGGGSSVPSPTDPPADDTPGTGGGDTQDLRLMIKQLSKRLDDVVIRQGAQRDRLDNVIPSFSQTLADIQNDINLISADQLAAAAGLGKAAAALATWGSSTPKMIAKNLKEASEALRGANR